MDTQSTNECMKPSCENDGLWPITLTARDRETEEVLGEDDAFLCSSHIMEAVGWTETENGIDYTLEGELALADGFYATYTRTPIGNGRDRIVIAGSPVANTLPTLSRDELLGVLADQLGVPLPETA